MQLGRIEIVGKAVERGFQAFPSYLEKLT